MDSDFVFLAAIPGILTIALLFARSSLRARIAITITIGLLQLAYQVPWDRHPAGSEWQSYVGGALLVLAPFAGVVFGQVLFRRQLEEHPWRMVLVVPVSYWLGLVVLGIQLGGTLGLIHI